MSLTIEPLSNAANLLAEAWPPDGWRNLHVAMALSGGADSVALVRAMVEIKQRVGGEGRIFALHVNHRLRHSESDEDAAWCQKFCQSLGVPLTVLMGEAGSRARDEGDGLESAARDERYELLSQAAHDGGARYLVTAHTYDDQVETVLLRMLRGAGLRGLSGIPRVRALSASLAIMRPLLHVKREILAAYLTELGQPYRTDSSNADMRFARNRVRNCLLPQLRTDYGASIDDELVNASKLAGEASRLLEVMAAEVLERCELERSDRRLSLCLTPLEGESTVLACEVVRLAWRRAGLAEQAMTHKWWQRLVRPAQNETLNLPGNVRASTAGDRLVLDW